MCKCYTQYTHIILILFLVQKKEGTFDQYSPTIINFVSIAGIKKKLSKLL